MERITVTVIEHERGADPSRRYRLGCRHGTSSALMSPGRSGVWDDAVLIALIAGHRIARGCDCPAVPELEAVPTAVGA